MNLFHEFGDDHDGLVEDIAAEYAILNELQVLRLVIEVDDRDHDRAEEEIAVDDVGGCQS